MLAHEWVILAHGSVTQQLRDTLPDMWDGKYRLYVVSSMQVPDGQSYLFQGARLLNMEWIRSVALARSRPYVD